mmetsp:Transcript_26370/g.44064  ORF Transcript_26370/g.44064 Transcript_26370/m.44064 type:complete len:112 (-) Transcript_26370:1020-1355(-)
MAIKRTPARIIGDESFFPKAQANVRRDTAARVTTSVLCSAHEPIDMTNGGLLLFGKKRRLLFVNIHRTQWGKRRVPCTTNVKPTFTASLQYKRGHVSHGSNLTMHMRLVEQ